jgi:hypothetical protein
MSFLVEPQNQGQQFVSGLASKPLRRVLIGLSLKTDGDGVSVVRPQTHWNGFLRFGLQTGGDGFSSVWASKLMVRICESFGLKTTWMVFTGLASKLVAMVSGGLASKPTATVLSGLASKHVVMVSAGLASKPIVTVFPSLTSKSVVSFLVEPQNQGSAGFPDLGLKTGSYSLVIWASKSS